MWSKPSVWFFPRGQKLQKQSEVSGETCNQEIEVGSEQWFQWLELPDSSSFNFRVSPHLSGVSDYSARRETRDRGGNYWSAYKRVRGKLRKLYLGKSEELTAEHLESIGRQFLELVSQSEVTQQKLGNKAVADTIPSEPLITITPTQLEAIASELIRDPELTRNGRDGGSVKRAIAAFVARLQDKG